MMSVSNPLILTIVYWLHLMATVVWIGGIISMAIIFLPSVQKTLENSQKSVLYAEIQRRFQPLGWLSLIVLAGTGMIQMGANSAYQGFLNINNSWAVALFSKHIAIILLVILMGIMTWGVLPALKRISLRQSLGKAIDEKEQKKYGRMEKQLLNGTLVLSVIILLLTAWARSAS
jgi:uncharacterized membrane protein